jgi:hypothetical protein
MMGYCFFRDSSEVIIGPHHSKSRVVSKSQNPVLACQSPPKSGEKWQVDFSLKRINENVGRIKLSYFKYLIDLCRNKQESVGEHSEDIVDKISTS